MENLRVAQNQSLQIRPVVESDIAELARIHWASWINAYAAVIPDEILSGIPVADFHATWVENLRDREHRHLLAEDNHRLVGFISFGTVAIHPKISEVKAIYIDPAMIGGGLGRQLTQSAIRELKALAFEGVSLWVVRENRPAIRFYMALGFRPTKRGSTRPAIPKRTSPRRMP